MKTGWYKISEADDINFIADQLLNAWELMTPEEMAGFLASSANISEDVLNDLVEEYYDNNMLRNDFLLMRRDIKDWIGAQI